jgi:hypothetical protein
LHSQAEEQLKLVEEQRKVLEERQRINDDERRRKNREQEVILNKKNARVPGCRLRLVGNRVDSIAWRVRVCVIVCILCQAHSEDRSLPHHGKYVNNYANELLLGRLVF